MILVNIFNLTNAFIYGLIVYFLTKGNKLSASWIDLNMTMAGMESTWTTILYTHVLKKGGHVIRSPLVEP